MCSIESESVTVTVTLTGMMYKIVFAVTDQCFVSSAGHLELFCIILSRLVLPCSVMFGSFFLFCCRSSDWPSLHARRTRSKELLPTKASAFSACS